MFTATKKSLFLNKSTQLLSDNVQENVNGVISKIENSLTEYMSDAVVQKVFNKTGLKENLLVSIQLSRSQVEQSDLTFEEKSAIQEAILSIELSVDNIVELAFVESDGQFKRNSKGWFKNIVKSVVKAVVLVAAVVTGIVVGIVVGAFVTAGSPNGAVLVAVAGIVGGVMLSNKFNVWIDDKWQ